MHGHARFWFFALLFCLLAARTAGAAETAGPKPTDLWTGDWLTVCDNTGSCRTAGYNTDGAERLITLSFYRKAGAQVMLLPRLSASSSAAISCGVSISLRVSGLPSIRKLPPSGNGSSLPR